MPARGELGEFLFRRRAGLSPDAVGLATHDDRRRVTGLRREELAHLAGVSPSYYTRLEQGQSVNASVEVLDAIAAALRLGDAEHEHLRTLARRPRTERVLRHPPVEHASPSLLALLRSLDAVPAMVADRRGDVLAWNPAWHALFAGHLDFDAPDRPHARPNGARLVFLDAHTRELHVDWPRKARAVVEHLRLVAGRHPHDAALASLIGELSSASAAFARLWAEHGVGVCDGGEQVLAHPVVGRVHVVQQAMRPVDAPEQVLVTITCEPGSPAEAALSLLHRAARPPRTAAPAEPER